MAQLLSDRHIEIIREVKNKAQSLIEMYSNNGLEANDIIERVVDTYRKENGFKIIKHRPKEPYRVDYSIVSDTYKFSIRGTKSRIALSRNIEIELEVTKQDKETIKSLEREPYRFKVIDRNTVLVIFGWGRL